MISLDLIIPTLGISPNFFSRYLPAYIDSDVISSIIIINNSCRISNIDFSIYNKAKLKVINFKTNEYVNPAWNLGVTKSKSEFICLLNDDIFISDKALLYALNLDWHHIDIVGVSLRASYYIPVRGPLRIRNLTIDKSLPLAVQFPFQAIGSCILMKRSSYSNIPKNLKIFFGDDYLFRNSKNPVIMSGSEIKGAISMSVNAISHNPSYIDSKFQLIQQDDWIYAMINIIELNSRDIAKHIYIYTGKGGVDSYFASYLFQSRLGYRQVAFGIRLDIHELKVFKRKARLYFQESPGSPIWIDLKEQKYTPLEFSSWINANGGINGIIAMLQSKKSWLNCGSQFAIASKDQNQ